MERIDPADAGANWEQMIALCRGERGQPPGISIPPVLGLGNMAGGLLLACQIVGWMQDEKKVNTSG